MTKIVNFNSPLAEKLNEHEAILPPLLSVSEVAKYLGLGRTVIYEMIRTGKLHHRRIRSHTIRIATSDLLEYLNQNKH